MKRITAIMMVVCMLFCGCAMPDVAETQDQQMPESIDTSADTSGDVQPPEVPEIKEGFFEKDGQTYLYLPELDKYAEANDNMSSGMEESTPYLYSVKFGSISEAIDKIGCRDFTAEQLAQISKRFVLRDPETGARKTHDYTMLNRLVISPELQIKDVLWSMNRSYVICGATNEDSIFTLGLGMGTPKDSACIISISDPYDYSSKKFFTDEEKYPTTDITLYGKTAKRVYPFEHSDSYYDHIFFEDDLRKVEVFVDNYSDGWVEQNFLITYKELNQMVVIETREFKTEPTLEWILSLAELVPATKQ